MRISDWSSDVCSSDLRKLLRRRDNGERGIGCDANAEIDLHSVGADRHWDGLDARQVQAFSHHGAAGIFDQGAAAGCLERQKRKAKAVPRAARPYNLIGNNAEDRKSVV